MSKRRAPGRASGARAAELRGRFLIAEGALIAAERLLPTFRGPGGDHEGVVFLLGRELPGAVLFTTVLAPEADHGPGHVISAPGQVAAASKAARALGLGILGQIHTHPGPISHHSSGDDYLAVLPYEGMISVVVPHFGHHGLRPLHSLGVHQFQDGRWILVTAASVRERFTPIPSALDLR